MRMLEYLNLAGQQIRKNKLRSFLTILGIVIGIASMIAVISVGDSGQDKINGELAKFGINRSWIFSEDGSMSISRGGVLSFDDAKMIEKRVKGLKAVCPASYRRLDISYNGKSVKSDLSGTTEALAQMEELSLDGGRFLSSGDVEYERRVIVLSQEAKEHLFGMEKAENEGVIINGMKFRVIGVEKSETPLYSSFFSGKCYIPLTVFNRMFNSQTINEISVAAKDSSLLKSVTDRSVSLLLNKYGDGSIKIINLSEEMQNAQNIIDIFQTVIGSVAAVSLIVGGIGIMNIMLVTVKERTREIGIRKAIGASEHHILGQFLAEAIIYSLMGGLLGVGIGSLFTVASAAILGVPASISATAIVLSVLFCVTVGVFFGIFPAYKASKLDPVEALRNE
jgi:putative ABC transport system permease protein